jgi:hypothetical protein
MLVTNNYSSDLGLNPQRVDIKLDVDNGLKTVSEIIAAIKSGDNFIETSIKCYDESYENALCTALNEIGITDIRYSGSYTLYKNKGVSALMSDIELERNLEFYSSYFECMIWADINSDTENYTDGLDYLSIDRDNLISAINELDAFFLQADEILEQTDYNHDQACHDFYLTRCHHGCGFWENDHCNESQGQLLTDIAQSFGTVDICIEDNKIFI